MNGDLRNAYPALAIVEEALLAEGAREFADEDLALAEEMLPAADFDLTDDDLPPDAHYINIHGDRVEL